MNRIVSFAVVLAAAAALSGCPVYSNDRVYRVCDSQGCFDCPDRTYSGACVSSSCAIPSDCPYGYACTYAGQCVATALPSAGVAAPSCSTPLECEGGSTCGADNLCHAGDCGGAVGCPGGYTCTLVGGTAQCLSSAPDGGSTGDAQPLDASPDAGDTGGDSTMSEEGSVDGATCLDGSCQ